jgi:large subunit ribosomal protein L10
MALSKQKKLEIVDEVSRVLQDSKLIVLARYSGTSVQSMQELRRQAGSKDTQVKVIKNRLFKRALASDPKFTDLDSSVLEGQLIYAYSSVDEVAPASSLAAFAKSQPQISFIGGITADGQLLNSQDVQQLANLPAKNQLLGSLTATVAAPLTNFTAVLAANIRGLVNVLNAKAQAK